MTWSIIITVLRGLYDRLGKEKFQLAMDKLFDAAEEQIAASETKADDIWLLPLIGVARVVLDVPDFPDVVCATPANKDKLTLAELKSMIISGAAGERGEIPDAVA